MAEFNRLSNTAIDRQKADKSKKATKSVFSAFRKNDAGVNSNDVIRFLDPEKLNEIREAARPVLAKFMATFMEQYVRVVVQEMCVAQQEGGKQLGELDKPGQDRARLRERTRGRRYVGDNAVAPRMEGWLRKKGDNKIGLRRWQLRYFVLSNKTLIYRKPRNKDSREIPPESYKATPISLGGCRVYTREVAEPSNREGGGKKGRSKSKGDPQPSGVKHLVCLQQPHNGRVYLLQADNKTEAREWVVALRKTIQMLPRLAKSTEDKAVQRAMWLAYKAWTDSQVDHPSPRIASPKEALIAVAMHDRAVKELHAPQLQELFDDLAQTMQDDALSRLRRKATSMVTRTLNEECRRVWMKTCHELQATIPHVKRSVTAHAANLRSYMGLYDETSEVVLAKDLVPMLKAVTMVGERIALLSASVLQRYMRDFHEDRADLLEKLEGEVLEEKDPCKAFYDTNLAWEVERFVHLYAVRAIQVPFAVGVMLQSNPVEAYEGFDAPLVLAGVARIVAECCKFLGTARRQDAQGDMAMMTAVLSVINPNEVTQAVARLLQFRKVLQMQGAKISKSAIMQEWMVTVDYTYDLLKDEVEEHQGTGCTLVEKRCSKRAAGDATLPVDSMLALSQMFDKLPDNLDVGFDVLEKHFCNGVGVSVSDGGQQYQGAHGSVAQRRAIACFDESARAALSSYMHSVARRLGGVLINVLHHALVGLFHRRHGAEGPDMLTWKEAIASASVRVRESATNALPKPLETYLPPETLLKDAVSRRIRGVLEQSLAGVVGMVESMAKKEDAELDMEDDHWSWPPAVMELEQRYVFGDTTTIEMMDGDDEGLMSDEDDSDRDSEDNSSDSDDD